jgi:hypothetical protein
MRKLRSRSAQHQLDISAPRDASKSRVNASSINEEFFGKNHVPVIPASNYR